MVTERIKPIEKQAKPQANGRVPASASTEDSGDRGYLIDCDWCEVDGEEILQPVRIRTPHNPYPDERHEIIVARLQRYMGVEQ